ncbi:MAG: choice-of-anchor Q domain-containing protein [Chloroflexota bacterium]
MFKLRPTLPLARLPKVVFLLGLCQLTLAALLFVSTTPVAQAATYNTTCTTAQLLLDIAAANTAGGANTINLAAGCTYTLTVVDNTLTVGLGTSGNGLPAITSQLTINGNGATITRSNTAPNFRIFYVQAGGTLTINNLTISGGNTGIGFAGGGIYSNGTLTVNNSTLSANSADIGGGIANNGTLTVNNSTLSANSVTGGNGNGGGIYNSTARTLTVNNSTLSANSASNAGGGIANGGILTMINSTLSANSASTFGGGIYNVTTLIIYNTLLSNNTATTNGNCDNTNGAVSGGGNMEFPAASGTCTAAGAGITLAGSDPLLGQSLANNGGPTQTIALPAGSPAIGAAIANCPATDQRYAPRTATCDIGAYQTGATLPSAPVLSQAFSPTSIAAGGTSTLTFTLTNPNTTLPLTLVLFSDTLPTQLTLAANGSTNTNCGTPSVTAATGTNVISVYEVTLAAAGSCTIAVSVTGTTPGAWNNTPSAPWAAETLSGVAPAAATLTVTAVAPTSNSLQATGGTTQSTNVNTAFAQTLQVTVSDAKGVPVSGITVIFTAPGSGASATFPNGNTATTNAQGLASVNVLANGTAGTYSVTATVAGIVNTVSFSLTNIAIPVIPAGVRPADLVLQLQVSPDRYASTDPTNLISYILAVKNVGPGQARDVKLEFPIDSNLEVGYAQFSREGMWVSEIVTSTAQPYVKIELPVLEPDAQQILTTTLVFRPKAQVTVGTVIFARYTGLWSDDQRAGKQVNSNGVRYQLSSDGSNRNDTGGKVQLFDPATINAAVGDTLTIKGDFYIPNEQVTWWYTDKDGVSTPLEASTADGEGKVSHELKVGDLKPGEVYVVAGFGNRSEVTGSLVITIVQPQPSPAPTAQPSN